MKEFFKDMMELQKESNKFLKKHWRGYILFSVIGGCVAFVSTFVILEKTIGNYLSKNDDLKEES